VHDGLVEDFFQVVLRQGGALDVVARAVLSRQTPRFHLGHWTLTIPATKIEDTWL
jgi:hypothetical protein